MEFTIVNKEPFPLLVVENFYSEEEQELIWQELDWLTNPGKLLSPKNYGGATSKTESRAVQLDNVYQDRKFSNILRVNRKLFDCNVLWPFSRLHDCCYNARKCDWDRTKIRYYYDGESYGAHRDPKAQFLACSYFYREPKKFEGGQLRFPKYDITLESKNNSIVIFPGWVEHEVVEVSINDGEYYSGNGRYCMTQFFGKDMANHNNFGD